MEEKGKLKNKEEKKSNSLISNNNNNIKINYNIILIIISLFIILSLSIIIYNKFFIKKYKYDYLIVGSGLYGSTFNYLAKQKGKKTLVLEKNNFIGGYLHCDNIEGIYVHKFGPHIFHTNNKTIWDFVNNLVEFNPYITQPLAKIKNKMYSLPYNMWTFQELWNITKPEKAKEKIENQKYKGIIYHLAHKAKSIIGNDIYNKFIKGDIIKKWGRDVEDLPPFIIEELPKRFIFDNNYFYEDKYQGIPKGCYNALIDKLLNNTEVITGVDYLLNREKYENLAEKIIFTGRIDEYYNYTYTPLDYRSYRYEHKILNKSNYQGAAIVKTPDIKKSYLKVIEHKHFEPYNKTLQELKKTVVSYEYNEPWNEMKEPMFPINDERSNNIYLKYEELAEKENKIIFAGRLGKYKYYSMQDTIKEVFEKFGM